MNIDIIIVTYNRLDKLRKTLSAYNKQSISFRNLIIVNNNSTDDTKKFLDEWKEEKSSFNKYIIHLTENLGGSGGFYHGEKFAMSLNPDWIFVADDDAYPDVNMISNFIEFTKSKNTEDIAAICAMVINADNSIALEHRCYVKSKLGITFNIYKSKREDYLLDSFNIDLLSYVGSFINVAIMKKAGLVNPRYFIYSDDTEHSLRLRKKGIIICVPNIKIKHDSGQDIDKNDSNIIISWRDYYAIRNSLHMIIKHKPIAALYITKNYLIDLLSSRIDSRKKILLKNAIIDAWKNKLDKHQLYRPGWKIEKN